MKIWCVDYAGSIPRINSRLFFNKREAEDFDKSWSFDGAYHKMYQVEDIWGWCGRNFNEILREIIHSRYTYDDNSCYIYNMCNEIKEAAEHCDLKQFSVDGFWVDGEQFIVSVAWVSEDKLHHITHKVHGLDKPYHYPTIVERRSKWEVTENVE